jgi:zinc D-Ala-D-Ala carboxypeptidase
MDEVTWSRYAPYFERHEFVCRHCGTEKMRRSFMDKLYVVRQEFNAPMTITSGYRCPQHPIEAAKATTGAHTTGGAADIAVTGRDAFRLLQIALKHGFTGIGVQQKGNGRFIHLDDCEDGFTLVRPMIWSYH